MDSLKGAALAFKRSPRLVRKKLDQIAGNRKGKKLIQSQDDETAFCVKKLGSFNLEGTYDVLFVETAVRTLLSDAKKARVETKTKLDKLFLVLTPDKILVEDATTKELLSEINLERIFNWRIDSRFSEVFSFTEERNDDVICHAFITPKPSVAEAASRAVTDAQQSLETWRKEGIERKREEVQDALNQEAAELYSDLGHVDQDVRGDVELESKEWNLMEDTDVDVLFGAGNVEFNAAEDFSSSEDETVEDSDDQMKYIYCNLGMKNEEREAEQVYGTNNEDNVLFQGTASVADVVTRTEEARTENPSTANLIDFDF